VITRFTESNVNLAAPFVKIITAAGPTVWPKLIQNLRASCETDWLDDGNPAHVVARWIGHSVKIQNDHYAQVDDHHFEQFNQRSKALAVQSAVDTSDAAGGAHGGAEDMRINAKRHTSKKASPPKPHRISGDCAPARSNAIESSVSGGGRTCNLRLRRPTLYPIELPRLEHRRRSQWCIAFTAMPRANEIHAYDNHIDGSFDGVPP
jgi:hypothetical protein